MFKNYITTAFRNLLRHKLYSAINIGGLAIGIAASLLIFLFVQDEMGYDSSVPEADRTYRLEVAMITPDRPPELGAAAQGALAPVLAEKSPLIEDATRLISPQVSAVQIGENLYSQDINYADPNFLNFFGFKALEGSIDNALANQSSIVLTESIARRFFGEDPAVGQTMVVDGEYAYVVSAVIPDLPDKTHLYFEVLAPFHGERHSWLPREWTSGNTFTYLRLISGADPSLIPELSHTLILENAGPRHEGYDILHTMRPVRDIHLYSDVQYDLKSGGNIETVYAFVAIAILVLVIACVNYINLATAQAITRTREVGIRKVFGAGRKTLIRQFLSESALVTLFALVLGLGISSLSLPFFNSVLGRSLELNIFSDPETGLIIAGLAVFIALAAGAYPAFYISSFRPQEVLKAGGPKNSSRSLLRSGLVFVQFAVAILLVTSTVVIASQTNFARTKDLGFEKKGVLLLRNIDDYNLLEASETLENELGSIPGVTATTMSQFVPSDIHEWNTFFRLPGEAGKEPILLNLLSMDFDFFDLYKIEMVAGRNLSAERGGDYMEVPSEAGQTFNTAVINETAVKTLGFEKPEDALGQTVIWDLEDGRLLNFNIVGVVNDFHLRSLHNKVRPMIYFRRDRMWGTLSVRFQTNDLGSLLEGVDTTWSRIAPDKPIMRTVLEDNLSTLYSSEEKTTQILLAFATLANIIAAFGLLGLSSFAAERRTREIGIRKVFGARTVDILRLMINQFSRPVILANLIALPIAWWVMRDWLEGFAYRIDLSPVFFLAAGLGTLALAWLTVALHATKVAHTNPIHALRYE